MTGENVWNLFEIDGKDVIHYRISGCDFKVVHSFNRFIKVFKHNLRFQKNNWYLIDCNSPIGTRLSYNNSDDIYFHRNNIY